MSLIEYQLWNFNYKKIKTNNSIFILAFTNSDLIVIHSLC